MLKALFAVILVAFDVRLPKEQQIDPPLAPLASFPMASGGDRLVRPTAEDRIHQLIQSN